MAEKKLIIEDELTLQETPAYNLKYQEYKVEPSSDGQTAFNKILHVFRTNGGIPYVFVSS